MKSGWIKERFWCWVEKYAPRSSRICQFAKHQAIKWEKYKKGQFVRFAVDVKPGEMVEIRPEAVIIRAQTDKPGPPVGLGDMFCEVTQMVRDREFERAGAFYSARRAAKSKT